MGLSEKLTEIKSEANALLTYANEKTGASDTTLGDAVQTLIDGFGGGGNDDLLSIGEHTYHGEFTIDTEITSGNIDVFSTTDEGVRVLNGFLQICVIEGKDISDYYGFRKNICILTRNNDNYGGCSSVNNNPRNHISVTSGNIGLYVSHNRNTGGGLLIKGYAANEVWRIKNGTYTVDYYNISLNI